MKRAGRRTIGLQPCGEPRQDIAAQSFQLAEGGSDVIQTTGIALVLDQVDGRQFRRTDTAAADSSPT